MIEENLSHVLSVHWFRCAQIHDASYEDFTQRWGQLRQIKFLENLIKLINEWISRWRQWQPKTNEPQINKWILYNNIVVMPAFIHPLCLADGISYLEIYWSASNEKQFLSQKKKTM